MLNAAVELFFEEGTRASLAEIGRRSGFSHGLVMARFGSKDQLVAAVSHEIHRRFRNEVATRLDGKEGIDALHAFVDAYCDSLVGQSVSNNAFFVLLGEALGPNEVIREAFAELDDLMRGVLAEMIVEAGEQHRGPEPLPAAAAAVLLIGMLRGIGAQARIRPEAVDINVCRDAVHTLLRTLFHP
jgi:AcrR family transcriptional regulator